MKFFGIFTGFLIIFLSFNIINGNDLKGGGFKIFKNIEDEDVFDDFVPDGEIGKIWGAINSDSVRVSG